MARKQDVIVIGGGIIGASIAWHLTRGGATVRLVAEQVGGVATPTSFAWINASWGNPEPYYRLRTRSIEEWQRLAADVADLQLSECGGLCWDLPPNELRRFASEHRNWGYDIREVSAKEAATLEPAVKTLPDLAVHARHEAAAEPVAATRALIRSALAGGMELLEGVRIIGLEATEGRMTGVRTETAFLGADRIVVAGGADTARLAATLGITIPVEAPPGLIVHSKPVPKMLNGLVIATELHVRQTQEGRIIAGSDFGGTDPGSDPDGAAKDLFDKVRAFLKGGDALEMDFHTVGYRPTPIDGFPIVGEVAGVDGLYLAVTHSGITLAPAIGRFAADEILTGEKQPLFAPYRLSRFEG
ncbi:MAG: FAD-binding oxidoreductase [Rhizobium sp.]|nr:FAD-binding oxidoreductase [Rhizobium sp.]